jgi:hypothetical protein
MSSRRGAGRNEMISMFNLDYGSSVASPNTLLCDGREAQAAAWLE